jgi:DALR anticodon binding domain
LSQLKQTVVVIQYPSLVQWLADRMGRSIALHSAPDSASDFISLPLFSPSDRTFGTFSSPLLLQLSRDAKTAVEAEFCQMICPKLWVNPAGWLYAAFSPNDLTTWLQSLLLKKPILLPLEHNSESSAINPAISSDPILFYLQHAHARCHGLLYLAGQEKFLPIENLEHYFQKCGSSLWQRESGELHLQTKAERAILTALMQFPQSLSPQKFAYGCAHLEQMGNETRVLWPLSPQHLYKQAIVWTQLFSDFYRDCRLFGEVQKNTPQVVLARFALIYIVKNVLSFLLEEILQVTAPPAL